MMRMEWRNTRGPRLRPLRHCAWGESAGQVLIRSLPFHRDFRLPIHVIRFLGGYVLSHFLNRSTSGY
jgi:hypothetical protein